MLNKSNVWTCFDLNSYRNPPKICNRCYQINIPHVDTFKSPETFRKKRQFSSRFRTDYPKNSSWIFQRNRFQNKNSVSIFTALPLATENMWDVCAHRAPALNKYSNARIETRALNKYAMRAFSYTVHAQGTQCARLVEIQKVPKKIAPKIWAYQMIRHTFLVTKI